MNALRTMPQSFKEQSLEDSSIEELMIALSLKSNGQVNVAPEGGRGQKLATCIPKVGDQTLQGSIRKLVGDDPNDPRCWKVITYF